MDNKQSILVCDDDPRIRQLIRVNLTHRNYQVAEFENGQQLINYLGHKSADLIILDLGMPVMNGFDACVWIRQHGITIPIIVLTAMEDGEARRQAFDSGASDYMTKPFLPQSLMAHMAEIMAIKPLY